MYGFAVFVIFVVIGYRFARQKNPYIRAHQKKWKNEKDYDGYIKWLDSKGGDMPIKEVKGKEERELMKEIENNFK